MHTYTKKHTSQCQTYTYILNSKAQQSCHGWADILQFNTLAKWMVEMYSHKQRNNTIYENNDAEKLKEIDVDLLRLSY